ncbi:MAG: DUF4214 domain-containing protein [Lachnospiraceae bacterium]|nr:DUF4214 domain-containing protein [Lachnospiraceae bacterium]
MVLGVYNAFLGRNPEPGCAWEGQITSGAMSLAGLVHGVYFGAEFGGSRLRDESGTPAPKSVSDSQTLLDGRDPDEKITDEEFIHILYSGILGREPGDAEVDAWMEKLSGGASWDDLVRAFIMSDEFLLRCQRINASRGWVTENGDVLYNKNIYYFIQNAYLTGLKRLGEFSGVEVWAYMINSGELSLADLPMHVLNSPEYQALNTTDEEFLTDLYAVALLREPDAPGMAAWLEYLSSGKTRAQAIADFTASEEFLAVVESILSEEQ